MKRKKMTKWEVRGWIHPKKSGDDRPFHWTFDSPSKYKKPELNKVVKKRLSRISAVTNDFVLKKRRR